MEDQHQVLRTVDHKEEKKPGYKKTKLGWIPVDWQIVRLGNISEIDRESLGSKTDPDYTFKYVSLSDIENRRIRKDISNIQFQNAPSRARRIVKNGDILLATVRPNLKSFAYVEDKEDNNLIASTGFSVISPKPEIDGRFLFNFLLSEKIEAQIYSLVVGSNYPAINSHDVQNLKILKPNLKEQVQIGSVIQCWNKGIHNLEHLIALKKAFKKGLMQQLLTGKKRLPGFSGEWKKHTYRKLLKEVKRDFDWSDSQEYDLISVRRRSGGLFHRDTLYGHQIKTKNLRTAHAGDFLISKMQIVHGASGLTTKKYDGMKISGSYIALVSRDKGTLDINFLNWYSKLPDFYHQCYISSYGVHIEKMTFDFKLFLKERIRVPELDEQKAIINVLEAAQKEIELLKKKKEVLQTQKKGLMQQLLTGKKRIKF